MQIRLSLTALFAVVVFSFAATLNAQDIKQSSVFAGKVVNILEKSIDDQDVILKENLFRLIRSEKNIFSDNTAEVKFVRFDPLPKLNDKTKLEGFGELKMHQF